MPCQEHKPLFKELTSRIRVYKRTISALDRDSSKNKKELKVLQHELDDLQLFFFNCNYPEQIKMRDSKCGFCARFNSPHQPIDWREWRERVCLPSSILEHSIRNREVVGESPAGGSI